VRQCLPELIDLIWSRKINPGMVFDLTLPLEQVAEDYRAVASVARSRRSCAREVRTDDCMDK
jgi:threonine dehydrogenase-like Zn-dependent dehydrogenase